METIKRSQIEEVEVHRFVTEASALRWKPGYFPVSFRVEESFGNGQPMLRQSLDEDRALYLQGNGCVVIVVYND
jgi:hypothetical protein